MPGLLAAVALLVGACVADSGRVGGLEDRVERLERSLATTTTSTTTTPPHSTSWGSHRSRSPSSRPAPGCSDAPGAAVRLVGLGWCRDHPAALGDAASDRDGALPARPSHGDVEALIAADPGLFGEVCAAALGGADGAVPSDYDDEVEPPRPRRSPRSSRRPPPIRAPSGRRSSASPPGNAPSAPPTWNPCSTRPSPPGGCRREPRATSSASGGWCAPTNSPPPAGSQPHRDDRRRGDPEVPPPGRFG